MFHPFEHSNMPNSSTLSRLLIHGGWKRSLPATALFPLGIFAGGLSVVGIMLRPFVMGKLPIVSLMLRHMFNKPNRSILCRLPSKIDPIWPDCMK